MSLETEKVFSAEWVFGNIPNISMNQEIPQILNDPEILPHNWQRSSVKYVLVSILPRFYCSVFHSNLHWVYLPVFGRHSYQMAWPASPASVCIWAHFTWLAHWWLTLVTKEVAHFKMRTSFLKLHCIDFQGKLALVSVYVSLHYLNLKQCFFVIRTWFHRLLQHQTLSSAHSLITVVASSAVSVLICPHRNVLVWAE